MQAKNTILMYLKNGTSSSKRSRKYNAGTSSSKHSRQYNAGTIAQNIAGSILPANPGNHLQTLFNKSVSYS